MTEKLKDLVSQENIPQLLQTAQVGLEYINVMSDQEGAADLDREVIGALTALQSALSRVLATGETSYVPTMVNGGPVED